MKTYLKNFVLVQATIIFILTWLALSPQAGAACVDGCNSSIFNTFQGDDALIFDTTGAGNTALGWRSLFATTDGSFNTGVGAGTLALSSGDIANNNTAVGTGAMLLNLSGDNNTAVGNNALLFNSTAFYNNAVGSFALWNNDSSGNGTANYNNAHGRGALESNVDGAANNAFGDSALFNSNGDLNVAVGHYAGSGLFTASNVIAIGADVTGFDTILGEVNDSCYIGNIYTGTVPIAGAPLLVFVDPDGKLGTTSVDAAGNKFQIPVQTLQRTAMLDQKVEGQQVTIRELKSTVAQLTAQLKEQAAQIQKVSAQLEVSKPAPQTVVTNQ